MARVDPLLGSSIEELADAIRARRVSPSELAESSLARIAALDGRLGAFITVADSSARAEARERERELDGGHDRGPLHGIPVALKDLYDTAGVRTTAGSRILRDNVPANDAEPVRRLREAGVVVLGKTSLHEWAYGVTNDNPHFGPARNPYDLERIPGGSSGGSAVALATGMCAASLGTDTGGSIRIPASLCGIVGLKPNSGRVSVRGVIPLSWTLDHAGPMTRTVRDAAIVLDVIAGYDADDPGSVDRPAVDGLARIEDGVRGITLGLPREHFFARADAEVAKLVRAAARVLESVGARLVEVGMPWIDEIAEAQATVLGADAASYHHERLETRADDFGADVRRRLDRGRTRTGPEVAAARRARARLRREMELLLRDVDALLVPATPISAPLRVGQDAVEAAARLTAFTAPFNLTGVPAISVPCGFTKQGLPVGLQLASASWTEQKLLRIARAYERETAWPRLATL